MAAKIINMDHSKRVEMKIKKYLKKFGIVPGIPGYEHMVNTLSSDKYFIIEQERETIKMYLKGALIVVIIVLIILSAIFKKDDN